MDEKLKKLMDALIGAGYDFSLGEEQTSISIYLEDWCLTLSKDGKWRLE